MTAQVIDFAEARRQRSERDSMASRMTAVPSQAAPALGWMPVWLFVPVWVAPVAWPSSGYG